MPETIDLAAVDAYLRDLQDRLCAAFEQADGRERFREDVWEREGGGGGRSRVLAEGELFEKAGVNYSHVWGAALPAAATAQRPLLAGRSFHAAGVSLVLHPRNPYVPIVHANVRVLVAERPAEQQTDEEPVWWFGGGMDLTPCYGFEQDARDWHRNARAACEPFGPDVYPRFKQWCDEYFFLPHRGETRGVGGLFFDDLNQWGFERSFAFLRGVGDRVAPGWLPIAERRRSTPWGERERAFQLWRRGRYVEFNLIYDRGTRFGLQSSGRTESILMSLPPLARWEYDWRPEPGSEEERTLREFLRPRDWI